MLDLRDSNKPQDCTALRWETNLEFWRQLHAVVDTEPHRDEFRILYEELAALGIARGTPFAPDERMTRMLEAAARTASGQTRAQAFADRRPDGVVWRDRQWQGRRSAGAGSLYWRGLRDNTGAYLDGANSYRLSSLFGIGDDSDRPVELSFGPSASAGHEDQWIQTIPGRGRFVYLRLYGPEGPAFDAGWRAGDFERQARGRERRARAASRETLSGKRHAEAQARPSSGRQTG